MVKQIIIMRKDLNMRKGKMVAQGSHASTGLILEKLFEASYNDTGKEIKDGKYTLSIEVEAGSSLDTWIRTGFTKICVYVNSEEELLDVYKKAKSAGLPSILIQDGGKTEFNGVPTYTCAGIGPADSEDIDKITGDLPLL